MNIRHKRHICAVVGALGIGLAYGAIIAMATGSARVIGMIGLLVGFGALWKGGYIN